MAIFATLGLIAALSVAAVQTEAGGWTIEPAGAGRGEVLSLQLGSGQSYRFECTPGDVIVTQTRVTQLLGEGNTRVGDGPDAVMPEGAAMMALYSGKDPEFQPAQAVKNPAGGWDLTIRVAKDDKLLNAMPKSKTMSLFTTGITTAVEMSDQAQDVEGLPDPLPRAELMPVFPLRFGRVARAWVLACVVAAGALGLAACSEPSRGAEPPRIETSWIGGSGELPGNLILGIRNRGSAAICLPRNHTEQNLLMYQAGTQVHWNMGNSGTLIWRGLDVVTGVIVVPPGEQSEVYYTLGDWPLTAGPAEARINLMIVDCAELFTSATPRITREVTGYRFIAPPPAATPDALEGRTTGA